MPLAQFWQFWPLPAGRNLPWAQSVQIFAAGSENLPAGQASQAGCWEPVVAMKVKPMQSLHEICPVVGCVLPEAQSTHERAAV